MFTQTTRRCSATTRTVRKIGTTAGCITVGRSASDVTTEAGAATYITWLYLLRQYVYNHFHIFHVIVGLNRVYILN